MNKEDLTVLNAFLLTNRIETITQSEFEEVKKSISKLLKESEHLHNNWFDLKKYLEEKKDIRTYFTEHLDYGVVVKDILEKMEGMCFENE